MFHVYSMSVLLYMYKCRHTVSMEHKWIVNQYVYPYSVCVYIQYVYKEAKQAVQHRLHYCGGASDQLGTRLWRVHSVVITLIAHAIEDCRAGDTD